MLFLRQRFGSGVRCFSLSVSSSGQDKPIAFGPGSVLNGNVLLTLDKPTEAYNIRVVFKGQEKCPNRQISTLFTVETLVWGQSKQDGVLETLEEGSHMYLFAIKWPQINFPPSMQGSYFGYSVEYTLQAFIEFGVGSAATTPVNVMYLPLITCDHQVTPSSITQTSHQVKVTASLIRAAYCPGDLCTLKISMDNHSDQRVTHVQLVFVCIATNLAVARMDSLQSSAPIFSTTAQKRKQHTLYSETFFVSIPKRSEQNHSIFQFRIPPNCVPSTKNMVGKAVDIAYEVHVNVGLTQPNSSTNVWPFNKSNMIAGIHLPVTIATVPTTCILPPKLQLPIHTYNDDSIEAPTFIPNIESPLPSPSSPIFSSKGSWLQTSSISDGDISPAGSIHLDDSDDRRDMPIVNQDASGHLMIPTEIRHRHNKSSSSVSSTDCSIENDYLASSPQFLAAVK
ncbi:uncharacterized protein BYT42DRAFT_615725 [Radiomyces spectabilis]|uniref:uncharacterized protein n=1 Tax=Radiomyces spectabilis TaxID=64574 RepID=UPI002221146C|nr:uncharacterized protein BYT42DRAFT_615725 [Radiomyces spectabilis]KAI8374576.1 hypothetical protein BYT42DRAFT_615725 [Radiomyces spectabilis]